MLQVLYLLAALTFFLIFYAILDRLFNKNKSIAIRLDSISKLNSKDGNSELNRSLFSRIIKPVFEDISKLVIRVTPKEMLSGFEKKVHAAGFPYNFSVKGWVNIIAALIIIIPVLTIGFALMRQIDARKIFLVVLSEIAAGFILPNFFLGKKASDRQKRITNSLPDMLDLLTVSVEAGLGFDAALAKVIDKYPGELAVEFSRVLQEMKIGKNKRDALKSLSERVNVPDLTTLVGSIVQADQFGVSIGNVLRIQSEQIRQKRKQRAQEKAMKAPVKMLIPMVFFIFPTILSVLMGPVVIKIVKVFMK